MPKFIGNTIKGSIRIQDNAAPHESRIKLTYVQAIRLPANKIMASLNTSDKGSKGSYAKRWFNWYASPDTILNNENSTDNMKIKCG